MKSFLAFLLICFLAVPAHAADKESAYEQILRTGKIRCGYGLTVPFVERNPNTGEISGIMPDVMKEMGKLLHLDVEWTAEVDWGQMAIALKARKVDVVCSTLWISAARGRQMAYTQPLFFSRVDAYARKGDTRFDNNLSLINDPAITIATDDNDIAAEIARNDFPSAKTLVQPQMTPVDYLFMNVLTKKADVTFSHAAYVDAFMEKNPDSLQKIASARPLRLYNNALAMDIYEQELQDMLNAAITELQGSGTLDRILNRYEKDYPGYFLRAALPYRQD